VLGAGLTSLKDEGNPIDFPSLVQLGFGTGNANAMIQILMTGAQIGSMRT